MRVTLTGRAGLLFENGRVTALVDPHLADGLSDILLSANPDVILLTHAHGGHFDKKTLLHFAGRGITVLASRSAYEALSEFGSGFNRVLLAPHSVYSVGGVTFYSVKAEHNDPTAVGFILDDGEKTFYVSGDTLYNFDVIDDVLDLVEDGVDYAFLPISGSGCVMNAKDAADLAYEIGAGYAVPVHYDEKSAADFDFEDAMIIPFGTPTEL